MRGPPLAPTRGTLRRLLWESGLPFGDLVDGLLAVEVAPEDLRRLSEFLLNGLSETELRDCRAVLVEKGSAFGLGVLPRMQDLATFAAVVRGEWLLDVLREDRLSVHFQPVVETTDPGTIFAYECLLRGMGLLKDVDRDPYRAAIASKLLELSSDLGVAVVA